MNNRLQQFLELENLTPAKLADTIGVQRSGLSHILSGRNKPSYEFITRLLAKFPHINSDWLLMGKGKPYKDPQGEFFSGSPLLPSKNENSANGRNNQYTNIPYNGLPYNGVQYNGISNTNIQSDGLQFEDSPILDTLEEFFPESANGAYSQNNTDSIDTERVTEDFTASQPSENCVKQQNKPSDGKKKRIKRVIVFYNDGSFEELFPHIR